MGHNFSSPKERRNNEMKVAPAPKATRGPFLTRGSSERKETGSQFCKASNQPQSSHFACLKIGSEESTDCESNDSTKGSPDHLELHLPSKSIKCRDTLDDGDEEEDNQPQNCFPSSGGAPLLSFVTPRAWFNNRKSHGNPSSQQIEASEFLDSLPTVSSLEQQHPNSSSKNANQPRASAASAPVKCPPPRSSSKHTQAAAHAQDIDQYIHPSSMDHLQGLYDSRTWDMFLRITEARKKQQEPRTGHYATHAHEEHEYPQQHLYQNESINAGDSPPLPPSEIDPTSHFYGHFSHGDEMESAPEEGAGTSSSLGHEMMFDLE